MIPEGTVRKRCKRCRNLVLVPRVVPCENRFLLSGIWLSRMGETGEEHTIGVLCFECAFETPFGKKLFEGCEVILGFAGGQIQDLDNWDAVIHSNSG